MHHDFLPGYLEVGITLIPSLKTSGAFLLSFELLQKMGFVTFKSLLYLNVLITS